MTDSPTSTDTQKSPATTAGSSPQESSATPQTEIPSEPQTTTSPYSTQAPTPSELEAAKAKAEALLKEEEPAKAAKPAETKTTLMASGPDPSDSKDEAQVPPEVEAPQAPQEHVKKGSKALKVVGLVALMLVIGGGIGVGVTRLSSPQETTETRAPALQASGVIDNKEIMPDMYQYLVQKYVSQDPTAPVDLSIKAVTMAEPDSGVSGSAYFKYDPEEGLVFVFSRVTGLTSESETVPKLWIQRGSEYKLLGESEYILLGEMALTSEPEGTVSYFTAYYDDPTIMAFDWLIISYDSPEEEDMPQSIVVKVSTTLTSE
ncbi:MAG: hypothetical protein HYS86_00780 [Candidatus Chisholmbacteria bacterium]|nr:hypothetical protein [Candidatus Chisholmbacteria bacterium]